MPGTIKLSQMPKVRCSHILLSFDEALHSSHSRGRYFAVWEAKNIIASLKRGGYSWEQAVKEHSACPHSWYRDGDLGWFDLNDGVTPELYNACLISEKGELLSEPIESPYGIHIITRTG
jgi:hypothetical protein